MNLVSVVLMIWIGSMAALIPLEELMEAQVRQRYDMPEDAEVYDTLNALAREKEVGGVVLVV
jgi:hypothetical protein